MGFTLVNTQQRQTAHRFALRSLMAAFPVRALRHPAGGFPEQTDAVEYQLKWTPYCAQPFNVRSD
jgi:hypothetical protein